jgi:hypothetical protein
MVRPLARAVVLLLLCACGPQDTSTDTAETTDTSGTTGTSAPTSTSDTSDIPANLLECGAPTPCGVVLANSGDPGFPTPTAYTAEQTCALQQLAKAEPLRLHYSDDCEGMCYGALILVRGDGSAIVEPYQAVFAGGVDVDGIMAELASFADSELCAVKAPAFFEACLAAFDLNCASRSSWFDGCAKPAPAECAP